MGKHILEETEERCRFGSLHRFTVLPSNWLKFKGIFKALGCPREVLQGVGIAHTMMSKVSVKARGLGSVLVWFRYIRRVQWFGPNSAYVLFFTEGLVCFFQQTRVLASTRATALNLACRRGCTRQETPESKAKESSQD